jgi:hypothetical protein
MFEFVPNWFGVQFPLGGLVLLAVVLVLTLLLFRRP